MVKESAMSCDINPANAGFLKRDQAELALIPFKQERTRIRYPDINAIDRKDSGYGLPHAFPAYIVKWGNLGFSALAIPPLGLEIPIKKKDIPFVILDTKNSVDLDIKAKLDGYANLVAGFKIGRGSSIGIKFTYLAYRGNIAISSSKDKQKLTSLTNSVRQFMVLLGFRQTIIKNKLDIGIASKVLQSETIKLDMDTQIFDESSSEAYQATTPLASILAGIRYRSFPLILNLDLDYQRDSGQQKGMSFVALKQKKKDAYSSLAFRMGTTIRIKRNLSLLSGFSYQPAKLGPGGKGEDDPSGFGSYEVLENFTFETSIKPYWQIGVGFEKGFIKAKTKTKSKKRKKRSKKRRRRKIKPKTYYKLKVSTGIAYRRSSLGVDEDGEMPGSYLQTRLFIPLKIILQL